MELDMTTVSPKRKTIIYNPHFWAIAGIMAILISLYNAAYIGIASWFPWLQSMVTAREIYVFVLSFLFLIPLVYASAIFRLRGALIVWLLYLVAILPRELSEWPNFESSLRVGLFALVALLLGMFVALEFKAGLKEKEVPRRSSTRQAASLARILKLQDFERRRLSRELHDNTIQSLLVIANRARALEAGDFGELSPEARKQAEQIMVMILHAIDSVRRLTRDLRPGVLDNVGLMPALRWLAERLTHESGIRVDVVVNGREHKLPPDLELVIFRIAQEALNNVVRHSKATVATVTLDFITSDFKVIIRDNGQGFCLPQNMNEFADEGKLGLERMQRHARLINGTLNVRSEPGDGTEISLQARV